MFAPVRGSRIERNSRHFGARFAGQAKLGTEPASYQANCDGDVE